LKGLGFKPSRNSNKLNAASAAEVVGVAGQLLFSNALGAVLAGMIVVQ
jgi:hypothetical protein